MQRARCIAFLALLAALPALALAQDAPLTPRVVGADEETVIRRWGEPTERASDTHPAIGAHVAWHYASLPWPDGDPPGQRSVSVVFRNGRVVGALEAGVGLEDSTHAYERLRRRRTQIVNEWGALEADLKAFLRWVEGDEQWLVLLITHTAYPDIPAHQGRFVSIVGKIPVAAALAPLGGN